MSVSSGAGLQDLLQPWWETGGVLAPDPAAYWVFQPLLFPVIELVQQQSVSIPQPAPDWGDLGSLTSRLEDREDRVEVVEIQLARSLAGSPFSPRMTVEHLRKVEKQVKDALPKLGEETCGIYLSLESPSWSPQMVSNLQADRVLFDHEASPADQPLKTHWPIGRGVFHTTSRNIVLWVNHSDHLIVRSIERGGDVRSCVRRLRSLSQKLEENLKMSRHPTLGYLSLKPKHLGTGMQVKVILDLPCLSNHQPLLQKLLEKYHIRILHQQGHQQGHSFQLINASSLGTTEFHLLTKFFTGIKEILEFEQSLN